MDADANKTFRNSARDPGLLLAAIAVMFQMTGSSESMSVVPTSRMRPLAYSAAIASSNAWSVFCAIKFASGRESAIASLMTPLSMPRDLKMSLAEMVV